jgi:hypothetical protein
MKGRRLKDGDDVFAPGDYGRLADGWYARPPRGHMGCLRNHEVTEHEDGTITVSPSILITSTRGDGTAKEVWHGYLERGVWREC